MNTNSRHRQNILITMKYMELKVLITELTHQIDLDSWSPPYLPIVPVQWETLSVQFQWNLKMNEFKMKQFPVYVEMKVKSSSC